MTSQAKLFFSVLLTGAALFVFTVVSAATLNLAVIGNATTFKIGDQFFIDVHVDSEGTAVNAAQGTVQYPKDILEVSSIDKTDSIFNFWLQEPTFSNDTGKITFTGGSSNGVSGKALQVFRIVFKAKGNGQANLTLTDGAVTASDGSGTNVLTKMNGAQVTVSLTGAPAASPGVSPSASPAVPVVTSPVQITRPPVPAANTPKKPVLDVSLYPDPAKWYDASSPFLVKWNLPADISDVATAVNKQPNFDPTRSEGLFDSKTFGALDNGIWYLHVRFRNNKGWGETAHWRIAIDTDPPLPLEIKFSGGSTTDNPTPTIAYGTGDQLSGIDHYSIRIGTGDPIITQKTSYTLPLQAPGEHALIVGATDKAGNATEKSADLEILPIPAPVIAAITGNIYVGEGGLAVSGTALPGVSLILAVKTAAGQFVYPGSAVSDGNGNWNYKFDQLFKKGNYYVSAIAQDNRGALSLEVKSATISVREMPIITLAGVEITQTWFFVGLFIILLGGFAIGWHSSRLAKQQRRRKIMISQRDVEAICGLINKDLDTILKSLRDRKVDESALNEIQFILKRIKANVAKMQKYIPEDIGEIES